MADQSIGHRLEVWEKQGFDVGGLREIITNSNSDESAEKAVLKFEEIVERMVKLEGELISLDPTGHELEIEALRAKVTDPRNLGEVARGVIHLREKIRSRERESRRRKEIEQVIVGYKNLGYKVANMEEAMKGTLTDLELALSVFEDNLIIIENLKERIDALRGRGRDTELDSLQKWLMDLDNIDAVERSLTALEYRMNLGG